MRWPVLRILVGFVTFTVHQRSVSGGSTQDIQLYELNQTSDIAANGDSKLGGVVGVPYDPNDEERLDLERYLTHRAEKCNRLIQKFRNLGTKTEIPCLIPRFKLKLKIKSFGVMKEAEVEQHQDPSLIPDKEFIRQRMPTQPAPKPIKVAGLERKISRKEGEFRDWMRYSIYIPIAAFSDISMADLKTLLYQAELEIGEIVRRFNNKFLLRSMMFGWLYYKKVTTQRFAKFMKRLMPEFNIIRQIAITIEANFKNDVEYVPLTRRINNINQMMMINFDIMSVLVTIYMLGSRNLVQASQTSTDTDPTEVVLAIVIMAKPILFVGSLVVSGILWSAHGISLILPAVAQGVGAAYMALVTFQTVRLFVRDRPYYIAQNPKYKQLKEKRLKRSRPSLFTDYFFGKPAHIYRNIKTNGFGAWTHRNDNFANY